MIKKYICHFSRESKHRTLIFNIEPSPVSEIWASLITESSPHHIQTILPRNRQYMQNKFNELIECLKRLGQQDLPKNLTEVSQQYLNDLHKQFQFHMEGFQKENPDVESLNVLVHFLERMFKAQLSVHYAVWASEPYDKCVKISDDIRPYWSTKTVCRPAGSLYLGYSTIGKNLKHIFNDRDIDLIKDGGIRPQQFISSEVSMVFDPALVFDSKSRIEQTKTWARNNNLDIDFEDLSNLHCDEPFLGQADTTSQELEDLFVNYDFVKVSIE